jgi:hypothetical protein
VKVNSPTLKLPGPSAARSGIAAAKKVIDANHGKTIARMGRLLIGAPKFVKRSALGRRFNLKPPQIAFWQRRQ